MIAIGGERRVWFVLPDGQLDEVNVLHPLVASAYTIARQLNSQYFIRCVAHDPAKMMQIWGCWSVANLSTVSAGSVLSANAPHKTVISEDISAAHMWCLAKMGAV